MELTQNCIVMIVSSYLKLIYIHITTPEVIIGYLGGLQNPQDESDEIFVHKIGSRPEFLDFFFSKSTISPLARPRVFQTSQNREIWIGNFKIRLVWSIFDFGIF